MLVYDCENRLTTAGSVGYGYDLLGRRSWRADTGTTTYYVYDGPHIVAEYNSGGSLTKKYIYGPGVDNPVAMINVSGASETWYYYYADALGSIRLITNAAGAVVESYTYDPYGKPYVMTSVGTDGNWLTEDTTTSQTSAIGNRLMFTAREWDSVTGLYHYRMRDYSPTLGRFLQPDPIGYYDSMNLYQYCGNNPVNFIDPWGLYQFGYRGLEKNSNLQNASWLVGGILGGPTGALLLRGALNYSNIELYHEAGFYEDGSGDVADFGGAGRNEDRSKYTMRGRHYDDDLMRQAQANVDAQRALHPRAYDKYKNNCQHYCSELRKEYKRLEKEKERMKSQKTSNNP